MKSIVSKEEVKLFALVTALGLTISALVHPDQLLFALIFAGVAGALIRCSLQWPNSRFARWLRR